MTFLVFLYDVDQGPDLKILRFILILSEDVKLS